MENNKLVAGILAAAISIIVLASVLMPVLNDATTTEDTFTNEGYFRMTHYDTTTDQTLTWTYEKPSIATVDNVDVPINYKVKNGQVTVVADTNWIVRMYNDANGDPSGLSLVLPIGGTTGADVSNNATVTMSFSAGSMSATFGTTSKTGTYTDIYLPSLDGSFLMKDANVDAYILPDSQVVGYGMTRVRTATGIQGSPGTGISLVGNYEDGIVASVWRAGDGTTVTNPQMNVTSDPNHIDLYTLQSITATATVTETIDEQTVTTDSTITYTYLLVPYEVTAERSIHLTDAMNGILSVIPILIIVAVLLGVLAVFIKIKE